MICHLGFSKLMDEVVKEANEKIEGIKEKVR